MLRSLSRAHCALGSSLLARKPAEPPAKWSARAERRRSLRQTTYRTDRRGVTRRTDKRPRRR